MSVFSSILQTITAPVKSLVITMFGPSFIGQIVRGMMKTVGGYLGGLGLDGQVVSAFTNATEQLLVSLGLILISQIGSAVATKKALDTVPDMPVTVSGNK